MATNVPLVAARTFLILNGVNVQAVQVDKWLTFLRLAEGSLTEEELGEWIRNRMCEEIESLRDSGAMPRSVIE